MRRLLCLLFLLIPLVAHAQTPGTSQFPTSLDGSVSLPVAADSKVTFLTASATNVVTTFTVNSTTGFPSSGVLLMPSGELVAYTGTSSTTFTGLTRGFSGTNAQAYSTNQTVKLSLSSAYVNGSRGAAVALETKIGIDGSGGTATPTNAGDVLTVTASGQTKWIAPGAGSGEANTASNVGTGGVGPFKQKTGVNLEFKNVNAGSSKVTVADDTANNEIDIDVSESNLSLNNISGTLNVNKGGTGSTTASGARTNLGLVIGTDVEAHNANLTTIAGLTPTTDNFIVAVSSAWASRTVAQVKSTLSLNNVTNDAQTKAAVVPNTAPSSGQLLVGNAGGTAYAPLSMSGDCSFASTGSITCTKTNGTSFAYFATGTDASNLTGSLSDSRLSSNVVLINRANTFGAFVQTFQGGANHLIVDPTDTTKKFQFDVSNVATATTRTVNIPNANSTTAQAVSAVSHQFLTAMSSQGVFSQAQPAAADISGLASSATTDTTNAANISSGTLPCGRLPALTGDVTTSAGACATTLANVPTGTPHAGSALFTNIAAPSTPAAGKDSVYVDSTDKRLHDKNDAGTIGTTVVADTGASNNFLTAISAAGVITKAQPSFSNLSGSVAASQMPALTGDCTTSAGAVATTCTKINGTDVTVAWTSYTATITLNNGATLTQAGSASYLQVGKIVFFSIRVSISSITGSPTAVFFALPVAVKSNTTIIGREAGNTGKIIQARFLAGNTVASTIRDYANTIMGGAVNDIYEFTGSYEAN